MSGVQLNKFTRDEFQIKTMLFYKTALGEHSVNIYRYFSVYFPARHFHAKIAPRISKHTVRSDASAKVVCFDPGPGRSLGTHERATNLSRDTSVPCTVPSKQSNRYSGLIKQIMNPNRLMVTTLQPRVPYYPSLPRTLYFLLRQRCRRR